MKNKMHYHLWIDPLLFKKFKAQCALAGNAMSTSFTYMMRMYVDGKITIPKVVLGVHGKKKG